MVDTVRAFVFCVVLANIHTHVTSTSCSDGSFPDENRKCVPCPQHCLVCDSSSKCLSCENGYWGNVCEIPCSKCKNGTSCEKTNGFCLEACRDGISGILCDAVCDNNCSTCERRNIYRCLKCASGRYPLVSCSNVCSTCYNTSCDEQGVCIYGCRRGYSGIKCDVSDKETNSLVLIIVIVAVAVIIIIILVVIIVYRKRRSNNSRSADHEATEATEMIERETVEKPTSERIEASKKDAGKSKAGSRTSKQKYTSKRHKKLYELAKSIQNKTDKIIWDEWQKFPTEFATLSKECMCKKLPGKLEQHRIGPYEFNKVIVEGKDKRYYFNASYIVVNFLLEKETLDEFSNLPREEKGRKAAYIASIGPTTEYGEGFDLFWRMVWQENCQTIVMLNTINTKGNEQYWPNVDTSKKYSRLSVDCKTEQQEKDYISRSFYIKDESEERTVNQFQYSAWPERGRVINTANFIEFCKTVQSQTPTGRGPILVHGRAGIGRTGTFIALDMLWKAAEDMLDSVDEPDDKRIVIQTYVENLRKQRTSMVETVEQYKFLHEAFAQVILNMLDERGYRKK